MRIELFEHPPALIVLREYNENLLAIVLLDNRWDRLQANTSGSFL